MESNVKEGVYNMSDNFEFEALNATYHYPRAIVKEFAPYLKGKVVEVGSGIGQLARFFAEKSGKDNFTAIEPDSNFVNQFKQQYPELKIIEGNVFSIDPDFSCNTIISVNVLEHIEDDVKELIRYREILKKNNGRLCILTPARPEIYSPIDKDFGHFRRYTIATLSDRLNKSGFLIEKIFYFNLPGYFAWWLNFKILRNRSFDLGKVVFFDRYIFRISHFLELILKRPPIGQSVIAIARSRKA
jgi:SAM-dependent methyltransferase